MIISYRIFRRDRLYKCIRWSSSFESSEECVSIDASDDHLSSNLLKSSSQKIHRLSLDLLKNASQKIHQMVIFLRISRRICLRGYIEWASPFKEFVSENALCDHLPSNLLKGVFLEMHQTVFFLRKIRRIQCRRMEWRNMTAWWRKTRWRSNLPDADFAPVCGAKSLPRIS